MKYTNSIEIALPRDTVAQLLDREIVGPGMWSVVRDRLTEASPSRRSGKARANTGSATC